MGRPKALLPFDGEPLVTHVVRTLAALFPQVVVVAAPDQELPPLEATVVHDLVPHQGPVAGIYHGLAAAGGDVGFVTSCDAVFPDPRLIGFIVSQVEEHDVAVPYWDGRFQPLHAAYRRSVLPHLERQLAIGDLRPVHLFGKVRTRRIDEREVRAIDPEGWSFFNMNTPEDYERALGVWPRSHGVKDAARAAGPPRVGCSVELFGVAQLLAGTKEIALDLPGEATLGEALAALAVRLPVLVGRVVHLDRRRLLDGYACSLNALGIVRDPDTRIANGDSIVVLAADAGG
jgi:molybdopterin-guanine dinucleotide biosynthesis protein A/molybdopterin converting factor small subunit